MRHKRKASCPVCQRVFPSFTKLFRHLFADHLKMGVVPSARTVKQGGYKQCPICDQVFMRGVVPHFYELYLSGCLVEHMMPVLMEQAFKQEAKPVHPICDRCTQLGQVKDCRMCKMIVEVRQRYTR